MVQFGEDMSRLVLSEVASDCDKAIVDVADLPCARNVTMAAAYSSVDSSLDNSSSRLVGVGLTFA
jgi:hypothetical protein